MDVSAANGSSLTRTLMLVFTGSELVGIMYEARWLMLLVVLLIVADFRYGWGESRKRYAEASGEGDKAMMEKYRWHKSRAIRRTINKFLDFTVFLTVGVIIGSALLVPLGYPRIWGGMAAAAVVTLCEGISIMGHFLYLRGVEIESSTIIGFLKGALIGFAKSKSPDIGNGIEEGLREAAGHEEPQGKKRRRRKAEDKDTGE